MTKHDLTRTFSKYIQHRHTSADMIVQKMSRRVAVFIRCLRASSSSLDVNCVDELDLDSDNLVTFSEREEAVSIEPCHADPTTHHFPLLLACSRSL